MSDLSQHWWQRSAEEVIRIGLGRGVSPYKLCSIVGEIWNGRSKIRSEGHLIDASRLALYRRGVIKGIQDLGERIKVAANQTSLRTYTFDNSFDGRALCVYSFGSAGAERDVETIVLDLDFGNFVLPLAMSGDFFDGSIPLRDLVEQVISWIEEVDQKRTEIGSVALHLYNQFENLASESDGGLYPLRVHIKPKMCYKYDGWPDEVDFELIGLRLNTQLDWDIFCEDVLHGENFELGSDFAAVCRRRIRIKTYLEQTRSAGLVSDLALAVASDLGADVSELLAEAKRVNEIYRPKRALHDDEPPTFYLEEGVLHSRWYTPQLEYSNGLVRVSGDYPIALAVAAQGRLLADLVDYEPFRQAGAAVSRAEARNGALELMTDVWALPVEDVASVTPAQALAELRAVRKEARREISHRVSSSFRWQRLAPDL